MLRERIAGIIGVELNRVSIKTKSGEGLDAVGRGEALAATAIVLLEAATAT